MLDQSYAVNVKPSPRPGNGEHSTEDGADDGIGRSNEVCILVSSRVMCFFISQAAAPENSNTKGSGTSNEPGVNAEKSGPSS